MQNLLLGPQTRHVNDIPRNRIPKDLKGALCSFTTAFYYLQYL